AGEGATGVADARRGVLVGPGDLARGLIVRGDHRCALRRWGTVGRVLGATGVRLRARLRAVALLVHRDVLPVLGRSHLGALVALLAGRRVVLQDQAELGVVLAVRALAH